MPAIWVPSVCSVFSMMFNLLFIPLVFMVSIFRLFIFLVLFFLLPLWVGFHTFRGGSSARYTLIMLVSLNLTILHTVFFSAVISMVCVLVWFLVWFFIWFLVWFFGYGWVVPSVLIWGPSVVPSSIIRVLLRASYVLVFRSGVCILLILLLSRLQFSCH